jgi:hypothetical protein
MLITEDYRRLNSDLHANPDYGVSGHLSAREIKIVADTLGTRDILDYGCGKRTLAHALDWPIRNYDPAIPEFASPPEPADLVVCGDVMEHIEPACLDAVLDDLQRLTKDVVFMTIATGPAVAKLLPDGRNPHLIQKPLTWWLPHLEKRFCTVRYWTTENGFFYIGRAFARQFDVLDLSAIGPAVQVKEIKVKSVWSDEQRCDNIRSAMLRGLPSVVPLPAHDKVMSLCCYGPSLLDSIDRIKREQGDVYTVSGAHAVLIERGIVPMGHIESDPRPHKAACIGTPHPGVCYFLSSACNREVFDTLQGQERWLFHVTSSASESRLIASMESGQRAFTIDGGTNVGMSAIGLGTVLGYRLFSIHGMDCSFRADHNILHWPRDRDMPEDFRQRVHCHAGAHPNEDQMLMRVWLNDKPFITSAQMMQGAQDFLATYNVLRHCRFQVHGDGYLPALMEHVFNSRKR